MGRRKGGEGQQDVACLDEASLVHLWSLSLLRVSEPAKAAASAAGPGPGLGVLATHGSRGPGLLLLRQSGRLFALATE